MPERPVAIRSFQSTLPVWGATYSSSIRSAQARISIHAPRVGSDCFFRKVQSYFLYFNPRSPCGERLREFKAGNGIFLISIHAPRVGSDHQHHPGNLFLIISIHAPRVGSDTNRWDTPALSLKISIHAPRVGSDSKDTQILLRIFGEEVEYLLFCGRDAGASMEGKR